jgi:hypothetical protein
MGFITAIFIGLVSSAVLIFCMDQQSQGNPMGVITFFGIAITGWIIMLHYTKKEGKK